MPDSRKRIADVALLIALMVYIFAGVALVPEHGDEFMQTSMARDVFYMLHGEWAKIFFSPPVQPDSEQSLRLINGTVGKTLIGLTWLISGRSIESLPGIYVWPMPRDWNEREGNVPSREELNIARIPLALLTALGVIPAFLLGWHLRLRSLAYPTALLYSLHPVILLNGRRAMFESGLMLFSLLTMAWLLSLIFTEHSATANGLMRRMPRWMRYGGLGVLAGLTIASKHSGLIVVVSALGGLLITEIAREKPIRFKRAFGLTLGVALIALLTWLIANPAYWNDPLGAIRYTINARAELLATQYSLAEQSENPIVYHTFGERLEGVLTQPFLKPVQFYESDTWQGLIADQIKEYEETTIDGLNWGSFVGFILTVLALIGLASLIYDAVRQNKIAWAILIWTGLTVFSSLWIPMAWQRYYLPLILVAIVLAAAGLGRLLVRRTAEEKRPTVVENTVAA